jgi:hypothetical protein
MTHKKLFCLITLILRDFIILLKLLVKHKKYAFFCKKILAFLDFQALESLLKKRIFTIPLKSDVHWV